MDVFDTDKFRFIWREEALKLAKENGQFRKNNNPQNTGNYDILHSEDLR